MPGAKTDAGRSVKRPTRFIDDWQTNDLSKLTVPEADKRTTALWNTKMHTTSFFLSHYLVLVLIGLCAYLFGRRLTERFKYCSFWEQLSFSIALGLGVISYLILILGLFGGLYPGIVLAILAVGALLCYPVWGGWPRAALDLYGRLGQFTMGQRLAAIALVVVALALLAPVTLLPLYPPTQFDATMYHLPFAKIYAQRREIVFTPYLRYVSSPQVNEMLFTFALMVYDDLLAQLTQFLMLMATAAATLGFGVRHFSPRVGWWAAALWLANPLALWLAASAYVDVGLTFYVTMTIYAFWNWRAARETRWLCLAGIFCGLAIGVKLLAFFFAGALGLFVLYSALRERRYEWPLVFGALALAVASPWLARNAYATGNPVYPLFQGALGRMLGGAGGGAQAAYAQAAFDKIPYIAKEYTFAALAKLPWNLVFAPETFAGSARLSVIYPCALPLVVGASILGARFRGLLILTALYTPFWFFTIQDLRYLIPIVPALSLVTAEAVDQWARRWPKRSTRAPQRTGLSWALGPAITAVVGVLLLVPACGYAMSRLREDGPFPINPLQRGEYLTRRLTTYPLYQRLNRLKGKGYALYAAFDPQMAYFADGLFMGDWFGPASYFNIHSPKRVSGVVDARFFDGETVYRTLKALGADYFLVSSRQFHPVFTQDEFFQSHFKLIDAHAYGSLFELTEQPCRPAPGPNLLHNGGFEEVESGSPKEWSVVGAPTFAATAEQSYQGRGALNAHGADNVMYQRAPVKQEMLYGLSCQARALAANQLARLQINWADAQGGFISTDIEVISPGAGWKNFKMNVSAPPGAVTAIVYASGHGDSSVWFDDFALNEIAYEAVP
jgi:4-amino-4-deoxy-L-arabinose transferase-like glycosyltransferase